MVKYSRAAAGVFFLFVAATFTIADATLTYAVLGVGLLAAALLDFKAERVRRHLFPPQAEKTLLKQEKAAARVDAAAEALLKKASRAEAHGDLQLALQLYKELLDKCPGSSLETDARTSLRLLEQRVTKPTTSDGAG